MHIRVDGSRELIDVVSDAAKLCRYIVSTCDNDHFFFENTVPDEVADEVIVTIGTILDPLLFLQQSREKK